MHVEVSDELVGISSLVLNVGFRSKLESSGPRLSPLNQFVCSISLFQVVDLLLWGDDYREESLIKVSVYLHDLVETPLSKLGMSLPFVCLSNVKSGRMGSDVTLP